MNTGSKTATSNIDRLAARGMVFTDAHSGSAVRTPTRYGFLTERYAWRSGLRSSVLGGYSPPLIEPGRPAVASLLSKYGCRTACIGKWHPDLDWPTTKPVQFADAIMPNDNTNATEQMQPITPNRSKMDRPPSASTSSSESPPRSICPCCFHPRRPQRRGRHHN